VLPNVSWSRDEYAALGVPFSRRGKLLDEYPEIWAKLWGPSPVSHESEYYAFQDVYFEPKAYRPDGPRLCFGGAGMHDAMVRRIVRYGHAFNPLGKVTPEQMQTLKTAMAAAGRDIADLEMIGSTRAVFPDDNSCADLAQALEPIPEQMAQGFTTFCVKPSQFTDDPNGVGAFCREVMRRVESLTS
jgi:alkanesulfonate monooxygenase SsuD/methylene tetrahydromethanopterin reductase-like flavin-dependent oxidoreductase (luciferase family)